MWKEKTSQAKTLLESNIDVMAALRAYYTTLLDNEDFPLKTECRRSIQNFAADVESNVVWIKMQVRRLDLLAEIIGDRKNLVCSIIHLTAGNSIPDHPRLPNIFRTRLQRGLKS